MTLDSRWYVRGSTGTKNYLPLVESYTGTGRRPRKQFVTRFGVSDAAQYLGSLILPRVFYLNIVIEGEEGLAGAVADYYPLLVPKPDRLVTIGYDAEIGELEIDVILEEGMSKSSPSMSTGFRRDQLRFLAPQPAWRHSTEQSVDLDKRDWFSSGAYLAERTEDGWVDHAADGVVRVIKYFNGTLWAGGAFSTIGGVSADSIAYYDNDLETWVEPGGGLNAAVYDLFQLPDGTILVAGEFTESGTGAVTGLNKLALWNGTTWLTTYSPASASGNEARRVCLTSEGDIAVGGDFTNWNSSGYNYFVIHNGTTWTHPGGIDNIVSGMVLGLDGYLYVRGSFTGAAKRRRDGTWETLGSLTAEETGIDIGPDGRIYTSDTAAGGEILTWGGFAWQSVVLEASESFTLLRVFSDGSIWVDGWGTLPLFWKSGRWQSPGWRLTSNLALIDVAGDTGTSRLAISYNGTSDFRTEGQADVLYSGTVPAAPKISFSGPGELVLIRNFRTGKVIYFSGLTLISGEVAVLDLANLTFESNWRGDLSWAIDQAGDFGTFRLEPGTNSIMVLSDVGGSPDMVLTYHRLLEGLEEGG